MCVHTLHVCICSNRQCVDLQCQRSSTSISFAFMFMGMYSASFFFFFLKPTQVREMDLVPDTSVDLLSRQYFVLSLE